MLEYIYHSNHYATYSSKKAIINANNPVDNYSESVSEPDSEEEVESDSESDSDPEV